jgi:hypothetical protein
MNPQKLYDAIHDIDVSGEADPVELRDILRQAAYETEALLAELAEFRAIANDLCDYNAQYLKDIAKKYEILYGAGVEESPFVRRFRDLLNKSKVLPCGSEPYNDNDWHTCWMSREKVKIKRAIWQIKPELSDVVMKLTLNELVLLAEAIGIKAEDIN